MIDGDWLGIGMVTAGVWDLSLSVCRHLLFKHCVARVEGSFLSFSFFLEAFVACGSV